MKHAGIAALDTLEPLLAKIRALPKLREKSRGVFYVKSTASLHFHEDPAGLFGDIQISGEWHRYDVTNETSRKKFLAAVRKEFANEE